jgi:hypothetical protein
VPGHSIREDKAVSCGSLIWNTILIHACEKGKKSGKISRVWRWNLERLADIIDITSLFSPKIIACIIRDVSLPCYLRDSCSYITQQKCFLFGHNYFNVSDIIHYPTSSLLTISILFLYYVITATDYFRSARLFLLENKTFFDQLQNNGVQLIILRVLHFTNSHCFNILDFSSKLWMLNWI